jgi:VWFA-related protein
MRNFSRSATSLRKGLCLILSLSCLSIGGLSQQAADYTFRAQTELVLVNVTVRDKSGNFVRDLKADDFTILEDNKPQKATSFDIENTDVIPPSTVPQLSLLNPPQQTTRAPAAPPRNESSSNSLKDRRLMVLFFDLTSMQPEEIERASTAALNYVNKQMVPADLVAVMSLGNSLTVNQDFTADRDLLKKTLSAFNEGGGQGFEEGATGSTEGTADTGQAFTVDDTEYNIFNTDRRLEALRSVAASLAKVDQKKSLIYFSSGMDRTGIENQSQLRAAINAAVRSNLAIYTMDIRGLQAMVPGGEAQSASLRGVAPYSGQSSINQLNSNFSSQ